MIFGSNLLKLWFFGKILSMVSIPIIWLWKELILKDDKFMKKKTSENLKQIQFIQIIQYK